MGKKTKVRVKDLTPKGGKDVRGGVTGPCNRRSK